MVGSVSQRSVHFLKREVAIFKRGNPYLSESAQYNSRLPAGHPEAFINAFANIYRAAARTIAARIAGVAPDPLDMDFPTVEDGARGVHFIHKVIESGKNANWIDARYHAPRT